MMSQTIEEVKSPCRTAALITGEKKSAFLPITCLHFSRRQVSYTDYRLQEIAYLCILDSFITTTLLVWLLSACVPHTIQFVIGYDSLMSPSGSSMMSKLRHGAPGEMNDTIQNRDTKQLTSNNNKPSANYLAQLDFF